MAVEVEGMDELNRALAELSPEVTKEVEAGIYAGGLVIQAEAQKNTPVEFGNLRGSAYTQRAMIGSGVEVGYSAEYAIYVHENMEQTLAGESRQSGLGTYWNPGGPKFLERAVNEKADEVLDQVRARVEKAIE